MNLTKLSDNVTTTATPSGVSSPQKITKRDVAVFGTLLMKCRGIDVIRRARKGGKIATDPDVRTIQAFCIQALKDVKAIRMMEEKAE